MQKQFGMSQERAESEMFKRILQAIHKEKRINKNVLCFNLNIPMRKYERYHTYLQDVFANEIEYDKENREWMSKRK